MKVKIEIDTKTFIRFWLVVIGFALAAWLIILARDALILVVISLFLALALNDPVSKIAKILPGSKKNRAGATAVAYVTLVAILGALLTFVVPTIIEQTGKFLSEIPDFVKSATSQDGGVRQFIDKNNLGNIVTEASQQISSLAIGYSKNIGNFLFGSLGAITNAVTSIFMILTMAFFMLVEGPSWLEKIWRLYSDREKHKLHRRIAHRMYRAVSAFVNGQLTVCAISGAMGAFVTTILSFTTGIPINLAIPVGVIMFTVGMIPMFGPLIAGVISSMILALNVWYAGAIFFGYFLIYSQIEANVISPMIQAKNNQLSALIIIVSIILGIYIAGLLGALLSIPTAACVKILIEELFLAKRRKKDDEKISIVELLKTIK